MSLENLVKEVRTQAEGRIADIKARTAAEKRSLDEEKEKRSTHLRNEEIQASDREIQRETMRIVAAANLHAKKMLTDAKERRIEHGYGILQERLQVFTKTKEYEELIASMAVAGLEVLGDEARLRVRTDDLKKLPPYLQGMIIKDHPVKSSGGIVVESRDGRRKLDMTFEELLRLHEDAVREILSKK